jgi:CHAT domain-containing protein/Tfp pilus assembly protein PilF
MRDRTLVLLGVLAAAAAVRAAAPPPAPLYLRVLRGEQAREAQRLQQDIDRLEAASRFRDAVAPAQRLAQLRARAQGTRHWQTISARWEVQRLERVAKLSAQQRADYAGLERLAASAAQLEEKSRHREAEPLRRRVLEGTTRALGQEHPDVARSWNNLALNLDAQGEHARAQPMHEKALVIARKCLGEEHPHLARICNNLGYNLNAQGKQARVQPLLEKALAIRRQWLGEDHPDTALSYNNLAGCLNDQGKYALAQPLHEKALALYRKVLGDDHPATALAYHTLAGNLDAQGQYAQAQPMYEKALRLRRKGLGDEHPVTAHSYYKVASNLQAQGRHAQAQPLYEQALRIWRKVLGDDHPLTATGYNGVASILNAQGQYAQMQPLLEKALAICRKRLGEQHTQTATGYNNLASNLDAQGRHEQARALYEKALAIHRAVLGEAHPSTAGSYNNLAANLYEQGKHAQAQPLLEKALAIYRQALGEEHPDTARSYHNLAANLYEQGKHAQAQRWYEKALAIRRKRLGEDHLATALNCRNLASCLRDQGKHAEALLLYQKALTIHRQALGEEHAHTTNSYARLAFHLYLLGKEEQAEHMAERACRSFLSARLHVAFTGLERAGFRADSSPQSLLALLRARAGKAAAAWQAFEQDLARGLLDEVAARQRLLPVGQREELDALRGRCHLLERQLAALSGNRNAESRRQQDRVREQLDRAGRELRTLQAKRAKEHGPVAGAVYDLVRIQKSLADDTALVGWLDLAGESWACVLRRRGAPLWARLPAARYQDVNDLSLELGRASQQRGEADPAWLAPARQLYRQRLAPLQRHLKGIRHLVVLPSPVLAEVPVETLLAAGQSGLTVSYAPSGTLFAFLQQRTRAGKSAPARLLALGDPLFAQAETASPRDADLARALRQHFAPLPGSRAEVRAIAKLFPAADTLLGAKASEQALDDLARQGKLKSYRFLHLATHGHASERQPLESFLALSDRDLPDPLTRVLAGKPAYTGQLKAGHILQSWELDADLVVLSACQSGLGKYEGGEGYVGFAQPLFACGARSLVMSLWSVPDRATALLMVRFYQNLLGKRQGLKRPLGKAEALGEAKRWLRSLSHQEADRALAALSPKLTLHARERSKKGKPFAHPFFWAAFILAGEPGPARLPPKPTP